MPSSNLPPPDPKTGVTNRRAASPRREKDFVESAYPVVSKAAYNAVIQNQGAHVNLTVRRLCQTRNLLAQALLVMDASIHEHNPQRPANKGREKEVKVVHNALRALRKSVEGAYARFPLRVE